MTVGSLRHRAAFAAKWAIARALSLPGAAAWRRRVIGSRALVLAYHRLLPEGTETWSHPGIIVTPDTFERQMRLLRREFRVISLDEFERHVATRTPFEPGSCLVTFDDGWLDTYTEAWPILRAHGIPAVVFLPTRFIGSQETFWQEELSRLLCQAASLVREAPGRLPALSTALERCGLGRVLPLLRAGAAGPLVDDVRAMKTDARIVPAEAITVLRAELGSAAARPHNDRFMTWDHAREMARGGITFGAHGHTHRILSTLPTAEAAEDVGTARAIIERELGAPVRSMSYPNGGWTAAVAETITAMGLLGFSMDRGAAAADDPPATFRRINIHEAVTSGDAFFRARILGAF